MSTALRDFLRASLHVVLIKDKNKFYNYTRFTTTVTDKGKAQVSECGSESCQGYMDLQLENVIFLYCGNFYHVVGVETVTILILFLAVFSSMNPKAEEILKHHPADR